MVLKQIACLLISIPDKESCLKWIRQCSSARGRIIWNHIIRSFLNVEPVQDAGEEPEELNLSQGLPKAPPLSSAKRDHFDARLKFAVDNESFGVEILGVGEVLWAVEDSSQNREDNSSLWEEVSLDMAISNGPPRNSTSNNVGSPL